MAESISPVSAETGYVPQFYHDAEKSANSVMFL